MSKKIGNPLDLQGEVFMRPDKRVGIAVPPQGIPDAVGFRVSWLYPADPDGKFPEWADMQVAFATVRCGDKAKTITIPCRINPELIKPPFFRLADCVMFVHLHSTELRADVGEGAKAFFGAPGKEEEFRFWRVRLADMLEVIMIDSGERVRYWS